MRFAQHSLVQHLLVNFKKLFLRTVDIDQSRDYVVLATFLGYELDWFARLERHRRPYFSGCLIFIWADVVLVENLLVLGWFLSLLGKEHLASWIVFLLNWRLHAWKGDVALVIELLIQLKVIIVQDNLNDFLQRVLSFVQKLLECIWDLLKH